MTKRPSTGVRKSTFPILTHRLANVEALPVISEELSDQESENERKDYSIIAAGRPVPNAVDVLAQIIRESVASGIAKLEQPASVGRGLTNRKRTALEEFGNDIDDRLFEMSQVVEDRLDLEARLRKSKRGLAELQSRWLEVKKQRDHLALDSDVIRRAHWEREENRKRRREISEAATRTEIELENETKDEGLEFLLRNVAEYASNLSSTGGLLAKVQSFNSQLEQMANVLER